MVTPYGIQLAAHLISSFYGDLCAKVCECLLRRGVLTLTQIIRFTELNRESVINCLRVLIHQNCVQAFAIQEEGAFGEPPKIFTQYLALFENILHKLRASKFLQIVSEELDQNCLGIFNGMLQHGRLSINQTIDRSGQMEGSSDVRVIHESFNKLVNARFIERCPAPEPFLAPPSEEEPSQKKRGAKGAKIPQRQLTLEQRALAAAGPPESLRFLVEIDELPEMSKKMTVGEKRKLDLMSDEDLLDENKRKEVLWRVNFKEFVRRLRNKVCVSYVKRAYDEAAGIVLAAILELSGRTEKGVKPGKLASLSINAIYDEVIKKEHGLGMDLQRVRASLDQLGCETVSTSFDESYIADIKRQIEMAQDEEVESVVLQRHGKEAYRIFRLLSKAGRFLDTDKISEINIATSEMKDTIKILNKLWKDTYLQMEKVPTSEVSQQPITVLWKVNKQPLRLHVLDEMYHAALNLRLRIAHELGQGKEILQLPRDKLVGELGKRYSRLSRLPIYVGKKKSWEMELSLDSDDFFERLPDEIVMLIFKKVGDVKPLCVSLSVCRRFRGIASQVDEVSLPILPRRKFSEPKMKRGFFKDLVMKTLMKPMFFISQMMILMKFKSKFEDENISDGCSYHFPGEILKPFGEIRRLHLQLSCNEEAYKHGVKIGETFLKWTAEFGQELRGCVILS